LDRIVLSTAWPRGLMRRFYGDHDRMILVQLAPSSSRSCVLG